MQCLLFPDLLFVLPRSSGSGDLDPCTSCRDTAQQTRGAAEAAALHSRRQHTARKDITRRIRSFVGTEKSSCPKEASSSGCSWYHGHFCDVFLSGGVFLCSVLEWSG